MSKEPEPTITDLVDRFLAEQRQLYAREKGLITHVQSVRAFLTAADWITAEHMPTVVTLMSCAEKLDIEVTASMVAQFGVTFRDLRSQAPGGAKGDDDPLEQELRKAGR